MLQIGYQVRAVRSKVSSVALEDIVRVIITAIQRKSASKPILSSPYAPRDRGACVDGFPEAHRTAKQSSIRNETVQSS